MPHDAFNIEFNLSPILFVFVGGIATLSCVWKIYQDMTSRPRRWTWVYALGLAIFMLVTVASLVANFDLPSIPWVLLSYILLLYIPLYFFVLCFSGLYVIKSVFVKPHHFPLIFSCLFAGLLYIGIEGLKWDKNYIPPQRKAINTVQVGQTTHPVTDVWVVEIPDRMLAKLPFYPQDAKYLTGIKKHVVSQAIPCKWADIFENKAKELITSSPFNKSYDITILPFPSQCETSCSGGKECENFKTTFNNFYAIDCPSYWTGNYCGNGVCIINPQTKEMIADYSQDFDQLALLLEAYKNWDAQHLLDR